MFKRLYLPSVPAETRFDTRPCLMWETRKRTAGPAKKLTKLSHPFRGQRRNLSPSAQRQRINER